MKRDLNLIGDHDVTASPASDYNYDGADMNLFQRILENPTGWLPHNPPFPLNITISCTLPNIHKFLHLLSTYYTGIIRLKRLTILHSFAPENLGEMVMEDLMGCLKKLRPDELCLEWYSGERIVAPSSLDKVAWLLRRPWALTMNSNLHRRPASKAEVSNKSPWYITHQQTSSVVEQMITSVGNPAEDSNNLEAWTAVISLAAKMTKNMIEVWREHLVKFEVRANWLDINRCVSVCFIGA